jgi:signal transduction histidine kinase
VKNESRRVFILFISFLFLVTLSKAQLAQKGFADLSNESVDMERPFKLAGEWEFYWNKLLQPEDFQNNQNPDYIYAPGSWHRQGNYSVCGYATYRLRVKLRRPSSSLALYLPIINASSKIFVNGKLMDETGRVGTSRESYEPQLTSTIITLPDDVSEYEIIIQVANYNYFSGGIAGYPLLDKSFELLTRVNRANGIENFFAGSLIALFIYQIILYSLYNRGKPYLWLALICLGVALRAMIVHNGSFLLPNLIPSIPWEVWKKIEFGSVYGISALFPLYVFHLFPEDAPRKPIYFFVGVASVLVLFVIFTPQHIFGQLLDVCHVTLLLGFIYAVYSITRAWRSGSKDARIILLGVLVSFPFILIEILKNSMFVALNVQFMYMVEMGVLVFLIFQVYLLANHYAQSYHRLEVMNRDLEQMVEERTGELMTANTVKDRLLSVMSHDIKSPLNSLRGILQIFHKGAITSEEFTHFTKHIEGDLNKTSILVENILYWTASQLKGVQVKKEKFDLSNLISDNVQLFQTVASNKKITVTHNNPQSLVINNDRNIINLVLRNLISNAIKFSFEGSSIIISAQRENGHINIDVKDDGVGMDEQTLRSIFEPELSVSKSGTGNESGTGLGLGLCQEYLQLAGGILEAESEPGKGSTFTMRLNLN